MYQRKAEGLTFLIVPKTSRNTIPTAPEHFMNELKSIHPFFNHPITLRCDVNIVPEFYRNSPQD